MVSFLESYIIAMTTQAFVTGLYFASVLLCLQWLVFSNTGRVLRKGINWSLVITTIVLFSLFVTDLGYALRDMFLIFEGDGDRSDKYFATSVTDFILFFSPIITDGVLIFRCWIVYNKSWRITALPLLLLLYNISSLPVSTYWDFDSNLIYAAGPFTDRLKGITGSYFASTIIINIYATSGIILQILRNSFSRRLHFAIRVIAESGLLYTLTSIATLSAVLLCPDDWFAITSAISFPTSGIAFNLILIRVAQNRASSEPELPIFIGDSTIERAIPTMPLHGSEMVA